LKDIDLLMKHIKKHLKNQNRKINQNQELKKSQWQKRIGQEKIYMEKMENNLKTINLCKWMIWKILKSKLENWRTE
jgi:hypothetical protein